MGQKLQPSLSQRLCYLSLYPPSNSDAEESALGREEAIEGAGTDFGEEVFGIGGFGLDELADGGEGRPGPLCFFAGGEVLA